MGNHRSAPRIGPLRAVVVGLAVLLGVLVVPAAAQASPYWRVSVGVTPGRGFCTVSWLRDYWDGPVSSYKIWVVPQAVAPGASSTYRKVTVVPQYPGTSKSVRIGSLTRGASYVFWLEALYPSYFRTGQVSVQQGTSRACVPL